MACQVSSGLHLLRAERNVLAPASPPPPWTPNGFLRWTSPPLQPPPPIAPPPMEFSTRMFHSQAYLSLDAKLVLSGEIGSAVDRLNQMESMAAAAAESGRGGPADGRRRHLLAKGTPEERNRTRVGRREERLRLEGEAYVRAQKDGYRILTQNSNLGEYWPMLRLTLFPK